MTDNGWRKYRQGVVLLAAFTLSACMMPIYQTASSPPPSNAPPVQVDSAKWASGMYTDLYAGKRVIAEGYYFRLAVLSGTLFQGAQHIDFMVSNMRFGSGENPHPTQVMGSSPSVEKYAPIEAYAPLAMRDQIFGIQNGQRIRVRGYATQGGVYSPFMGGSGAGLSHLRIVVESIELLNP
ncbi:MAG: hypothetical protein NTV97_02880 [Alphaproteobacteria bacterium]|nr:hypothetical protein [Alphaproteobacteria bacterium]